LWVQGSKDSTPLVRRQARLGVVFQEGAVFVSSEPFARFLASLALECHASNVSICRTEVEPFIMATGDWEVLQNITRRTSKRGPKKKIDKGWYVITCLEEAKSKQSEIDEIPTNCPDCGSPRIIYRKGKLKPVNGSGTLTSVWFGTRFYTGQFEVPRITPAAPLVTPSLDAICEQAAVQAAYSMAAQFPNLLLGLRAMDVAYCIVVSEGNGKARLDRRIATLREYYTQGGTKQYPMACPPIPDIVDLAAVDHDFMKCLSTNQSTGGTHVS
jgi:hypothetical protein